jgi:uncharacterized phage protein gp47/JayE
MATEYGITNQGFVSKPEDVILSELQADAQDAFGTEQDLSIYDPIGQMVSVMEKALYRQWQNLEDAYYSTFIKTATGISLDRAVALGGMSRLPAKSASVTLTCSGPYSPSGVAVSLAAGDILAQTQAGIKFQSVTSGVTVSGTVNVDAVALVPGIGGIVPPNSIIQLVNPVSGITAVTNALASIDGTDIESDAELRARYVARGISGGSSVPATLGALLQISEVTRANVYENNTDSTDGSGRPPHSIHCVVAGTATDAQIATAIFNSKAGGIQSYGAHSYNSVDANGDLHPIQWDTLTQKLVNVVVDVTSNAAWVAANISIIKTRVVEIIGGVDTVSGVATQYEGLTPGSNVYAWAIETNFDGIVGMDDVIVYLAFSPITPTSLRKLTIAATEYSRCDTAQITVNVA